MPITIPTAATPSDGYIKETHVQATKGKRWDPRPVETIRKIHETIEKLVLKEESTEVSVRAICEAANISRGTFYRYFKSKDDLLDSFGCYMREKFERKVVDLVSVAKTPNDRFSEYIKCIWIYLNSDNARHLFEIEPAFSIKYFRKNFQQSIDRTNHVLESTFTEWEGRVGIELDRHFLSELLVRYMLSELIVPSNRNHEDLLFRVQQMVTAIWPR